MLHWYAADDPRLERIEDGDCVLVWLAEKSLGSYIHSGRMRGGKFFTIGHLFAFDMPKVTHWAYQPGGPAD